MATTTNPAALRRFRGARPLARAGLAGLALLLVLWLAGGHAARADSDFLPVDSAFSPSAQRVDAEHIAVTWKIADGYYLYRHAFDFALVDAGKDHAGDAQIPSGHKHKDQFFGQVETYRDTVRVVVPVAGDAALPAGARLKVSYQGCADAGLCYPPQTRKLAVAPASANAAGGANTAGGSGPNTGGQAPAGGGESETGAQAATVAGTGQSAANNTGPASRQGQLAARLAHIGGAAGLATTLGLFFALGVLLAFTPCILPMIPILSGLIVGSGATTRWAFALSLAYVLAMAVAYTVFGVIAGYFGANIQAALQMPAVLIAFAGVFVVLALATFGVFEMQIPGAWRDRLGAIGARRGGLAGAALMGFFGALIAGPCLAPPLVGALLYISSSGDAVRGGAALFALGLGMGVPLLAIGTLGARFVPRAGAWMTQVRIFFGVLLIAVALWLVTRILTAEIALAAWGLLALVYAAYLSTRVPAGTTALAAKRAAVFVLFVYSGCAVVGVLAGGGRAVQPLAGLTGAQAQAGSSETRQSPFTRVADIRDLRSALDRAARADRAAVVDFYADWCVDCVQMEHAVFTKPKVRSALRGVTALQVDVTDYDSTDRKILKAMGVFGPPTVLFYGGNGKEARGIRLVGSVDSSGFMRRLQRVANAGA